MKKFVVMSGGFHPFHAGHADLYQQAKEAFPDAKVLVCATNVQSDRPFPFSLKKNLAQLSGVPPKDFIEVSRQFTVQDPALAQRIGNPDDAIVIYVRSDKDRNEPPTPWKLGPDGKPPVGKRGPKKGLPLSNYLLEYPGEGQPLDPVSKHAYMDYLKTVEFGPGITSASEIRNAWPKLNEKRKLAMVMSLYPTTKSNPQLAQNVVGMFDQVMGEQVDEGIGKALGTAALAGSLALGGLSQMGKTTNTNWDKLPQQISTQKDNRGNEKIMSVTGPNNKGEYRIRITADDDMHEFVTKTPPKGLKEEFRPSSSQAMNIHRQTAQKMNPGTNKFIWKRPNQIGGSYTENELKSLNFKYSAKYNMWGGTQQMWDRLAGKVNEFAPPSSDRGGGGEDERSRRLRKLLEIAIKVAEEQNVGTLGKIHAMNTIASDDFFRAAVQGILSDITDREYMFVIESAYKTVKQGMTESSLNEFVTGNGDEESGRWYTDSELADIIGDDWFEDFDVSNDGFNMDVRGEKAKKNLVDYANAWFDDRGYNVNVLGVENNEVDHNLQWYIVGSFHNPGFAKKDIAEDKASKNLDYLNEK
jgi:hypothetical protein